MSLRQALKEQYHAGLAMLAECVLTCPDELWHSGTYPRTFCRIAFHAAYFAQLYLGQTEDVFEPWPDRPQRQPDLWQRPLDLEPFELPDDYDPYTRQQMLDYIAFVDTLIDPTVDSLDLDTEDSGFYWYKNIGKLSHELMNVRHIQGHVGQLSELLMAGNIDTKWIAKV